MKITRFYTTSSGESRFQEIEVPSAPVGRGAGDGPNVTPNLYSSPGFEFAELPAGFDQDWHPAPTRQLVTILSGMMEVVTSDHQKRQWKSGDIVFADDTTGKGHQTRTVGGPARLFIVKLPLDFDVTKWPAA